MKILSSYAKKDADLVSQFSSRCWHKMTPGIPRFPLAFHLARTLMDTLRCPSQHTPEISLPWDTAENFSVCFLWNILWTAFLIFVKNLLNIHQMFNFLHKTDSTDCYFFSQIFLARSAISIQLLLNLIKPESEFMRWFWLR